MVVLLGLLTVVALVTPRYGVDSRIRTRPGPPRRRPTLAGDLRTVGRVLRSAGARVGQAVHSHSPRANTSRV